MKTKLKQIYYDMRHQPVIAWVTFLATAMSVFLIMVIIMMQNVKSAPFAPESCRDRLLLGVNLHVEDIEDQDINSSSSLSSEAARVLYDDIDGVEKISYYHKWMDDSSNDDLYSNVTPDLTSAKRMHLIIYAILLLVPAVNLSSMLHSRLSRRIREIGIRRAFGCTRKRIIADVIIENFIVTLLGGAVGVVTGVIFAATYSGLYNDYENFRYGDTPVMGALLNWQTVGVALMVCFILNIFSAALPAWYASILKPVEALNSK